MEVQRGEAASAAATSSMMAASNAARAARPASRPTAALPVKASLGGGYGVPLSELGQHPAAFDVPGKYYFFENKHKRILKYTF